MAAVRTRGVTGNYCQFTQFNLSHLIASTNFVQLSRDLILASK